MKLQQSFRFWNKWFLKSLSQYKGTLDSKKPGYPAGFFHVLPLLYHVKERCRVQSRQKRGCLIGAFTWKEISLRYLKGTSWKLAGFLSKGGLSGPCQPQPAALTAFLDQVESCSTKFQIVPDVQLLTSFAIAEIPHKQRKTKTVQFCYPSSMKRHNLFRSRNKICRFRDPMYSSSLQGD